MGSILSYFWSVPGRIDDPNPQTGLTSRDVHYVKSSWDRIKQDITNNGMAVFIKLFTKRPAYQKLFPFKNVPINELRKNKRFQAHCNSLMYAFTAIVDCIEDPELVTAALEKQGSAHVPRGVKEEDYWVLRDVLLEIFENIMSADEINSWKKLLELAFKIIIQGARKVKV